MPLMKSRLEEYVRTNGDKNIKLMYPHEAYNALKEGQKVVNPAQQKVNTRFEARWDWGEPAPNWLQGYAAQQPIYIVVDMEKPVVDLKDALRKVLPKLAVGDLDTVAEEILKLNIDWDAEKEKVMSLL